jgi:hypothetical protein
LGIKKAQWVKLGFSIFHFLRRSRLNLKDGVAVNPADKRLQRSTFAKPFFRLKYLVSQKNFSDNDIEFCLRIANPLWYLGQKHPKYLWRVSGGAKSSLGLIKPHQFLNSIKS